MANKHSNFLQGQRDKWLSFWPNHSGESWLLKQGVEGEEEEEEDEEEGEEGEEKQ